MHASTTVSATVGLLAPLLVHGAASASASASGCSTTLTRDVVVLGGGASGAHAAVWLRDHGKSVLLVEKHSQLGGHTNYYKDPATGKVINIGVQAWMQYENAFDFPARMNVSTSGSMTFTDNEALYIDFQSGRPVANYSAPADADKYAALQKYLDVLSQYKRYLLPGYAHFPDAADDDIPADLLMPFGAFAAKYGIEAAVPQIWDATAQGLGDTMHVSAMWVMQASTNPMIEALLGTAAAAVPASGRLYDLYQAVADFLGDDDVLYSSTVIATEQRDDQGVSLRIGGGPDDHNVVTCVDAKRLLVAFEPTAENLAPLAVDAAETAVFGQFDYSTVYAGLVRHPSLQANHSYSDRSSAAGSRNYTVFPVYAQIGRIEYVGGTEDLFQFTAVGTANDTADSMKARIADVIRTMMAAGTLPATEGNPAPTFPIFADHGKMHPRLSADAVRGGLIQKQLALQGHRSTYYTGAAFSAPFATVLWEYNKAFLPTVIAGI